MGENKETKRKMLSFGCFPAKKFRDVQIIYHVKELNGNKWCTAYLGKISREIVIKDNKSNAIAFIDKKFLTNTLRNLRN